MNIETGAENHERERFNLKKIPEFICLSVYILIRKLWRLQTILLLLAIIASAILLFTLFHYDARLRTLLRYKDFDSVQVIKCGHLKKIVL